MLNVLPADLNSAMLAARESADSYHQKLMLTGGHAPSAQLRRLFMQGFQLTIFLGDFCRELQSVSGLDPSKFSTKCSCRIIVLMVFERDLALGVAFRELSKIADEAGVQGGQKEYLAASRQYSTARRGVQRMNSIRNAAAHYDTDTERFFSAINAIDLDALGAAAEALMVVLGALIRYVDFIMAHRKPTTT